MIVALAGGVGAAKLLRGLVQVMPPEELTVIVNTGDDIDLYGLHISPDVDITIYSLGGVVDLQKGWGLIDETFHTLESLRRFGHDTWFNLGDRDFATHLHRAQRERQGWPISQITAELARSFGVKSTILPMTDQRVETRVRTPDGWLHFQEYLIQRRMVDPVLDITLAGVEKARPAPGVVEAIAAADGVIICPSNPLISVGTILAIPGIREALRETRAPVVGISPIVASAALKGPAVEMLRGLGLDPSAYGVAASYCDFLTGWIIDEQDAWLRNSIADLGLEVVVAPTIMNGREDEVALAKVTLDALARAPVGAGR